VPAGDFADLSLTFTATVVDASPDQQQQQQQASATTAPPRTHEVDLKPGGRDIAVRADNVVEYVHRLSDFRLNRQMDRAANAFLAGFFELIRPRWVRMFNEAELQMLISGSEEGIDVDDLVAHVNYAGERRSMCWFEQPGLSGSLVLWMLTSSSKGIEGRMQVLVSASYGYAATMATIVSFPVVEMYCASYHCASLGASADCSFMLLLGAGGYHEEHPVILTLWDAVRTFSPQQQRQFLKFVTSCSRAPLLGFKYLEPQLCIQMSGSVLSPDSRERLPTAATCMNLLKLPPYRDFDEMRGKLLYAITAGAGFELS
jgi:hypothetical protein